MNPLAGCLPALVQIPVFISLYRALTNLAAEVGSLACNSGDLTTAIGAVAALLPPSGVTDRCWCVLCVVAP